MAIAIKKTAAIAIAAGLTFAGSAGIAAQDALAQTRNTSAPATATAVQVASQIPAGNNFSLTINKRYNPTELRNGNGAVDNEVAGEALNGVKFTIQRLDGDIRKQADFNRLAKLSEDYNKAAVKPQVSKSNDQAKELTTGEGGQVNGQVKFTELPAGAYLVTETITKTAKPAGEYTANGTETLIAADPFIVFVPMTNTDGTGWISDVNVYPKNSFVRVEKAVQDENKHAKVNAGEKETNNRESNITYTLTGRVPSVAEGKSLTGLNLRDSYNNTELTFQTDRAKEGYYVQEVIVVDGKTGQKKATLSRSDVANDGNDYTVEDSVAFNDQVTDANAAFRISLTADGLKKVAPNDKVVATIVATMENAADKEIVNGVDEHGTIKRDGDANAKDEPFDTPKDEVKTYLGDIEVFKTGEKNGERKVLAGATFALSVCGTTDVLQTGTTNAEGKIKFEGLHVTDFVNNEKVDPPVKYCLKETDAPAGYTFDKDKVYELELTQATKNGAQPADFTKTGSTVQVAKYSDGGGVTMNGVAVNNIERNIPVLPSTGGMGVLITALAGLAIIGGGVYAARRNSQSA